MSADYELPGLMIFAVLAVTPIAFSLYAFCDWVKARCMRSPRRRWLLRLAIAADLAVVLCAVDAWFVEPRMLTVTRVSATSPKVAPETGALKIVHISDIHFERHTPLTKKLLATICAERPDLIVITGDNPQMRKYDSPQFREFLSELCGIAPAYAVPGFYEDQSAMLESPIGKHYLFASRHAELTIRGTAVVIQGFGPRDQPGPEAHVGDGDALYVVLHHTPDGIPYVAALGADWCFVGHTHGGQVRLPFWGAIITLSATGKRYEYGRYKIGKMEAFVTRGVGLEPRPAPQVRFLCPPEVVVLTLKR